MSSLTPRTASVPTRPPIRLRNRRAYVALIAAGAVAAGLPAFLLFFGVWPEIVVPAYFASRGGVLYETIFFPHTPLLILGLAAAGKVFGFSALLIRSVTAASMAACGVLLVLGARPIRKGAGGPLAGLLVGVPIFVLWNVYMEGPTIWPEPFMAPFLLAAVLCLEVFVKTGRRKGPLVAAGLLVGAAILTKQTAAWTIPPVLVWILLVLPFRRSLRAAVTFVASTALPYLAFVLLWGAIFRTVSHVRWTFVVPVLSGFAGEIGARIEGKDVLESLAAFLVFPAFFLVAGSLPGSRAWRSPALWVAIGVYGMTWPRWGLLHLAGATGILALTAARAVMASVAAFRRWRRRSAGRRKLVSVAVGEALLLIHLAVAVLAGGALALRGLGGPAFLWDDPATAALAEKVRARIRGGAFLNVYIAYENLYPLTGASTPDGTYVNPSLWYLLSRENVGDRLVNALSRRPGLLVLFREPRAPEQPLKKTSLYRFLMERTQVVEEIEPGTVWRVVR